jgi:selenide,water dikinase
MAAVPRAIASVVMADNPTLVHPVLEASMAETSAPLPRIRLTSLSHGAGCACKLGSVDLGEVLRHLPQVVDPRVLVDAATRDDAAVFRLSADRALVATVDFFTPIVDNPRDWGAIAAANALSDVYAMGGTPLFALNLVGWPREKLPFDMLGEVLAGAAMVAERAGCLLLGGHSIDVLEPLFGLVVIGEVHPDRTLSNAGACAGDVLVLTKPLGTGILSTALKRDALLEAGMADAVRSMTTLNDGAARAAVEVGVSAATDVTGFGLLGHLGNMLEASRVAAEIAYETLPLLPHARNLAARGIIPGGSQRNLQAAVKVEWADDLAPEDRILCVDAQTSGGLLLAVPPENEAALLDALRRAETPAAAVIGRLTPGPVGQIRVVRRFSS